MLKKTGAILSMEVGLVMIPMLLVLIFFVGAWQFVYSQQVLNQVATYSINYWAKNTAPDCNDVASWLATNAVDPAFAHFNFDASQVTLSTNYQALCNCSGSTISLTLDLNKTFLSHWNPITANAYAIAIKEGDHGANC